jgi:hypothetical protein
MAFDVLNVGSAPNDGNGESLRSGGQKINANFAKAVEAPAATVTNNTAVVFDGTTGKLVKQAGTSIAALAGKFAPTGNITAGNGMYLPAADTVAFSTAGAERLRITSTGNVGVGTQSAISKMQISPANAAGDQGVVAVTLGNESNTARGSQIVKNTSSPYDLKFISSLNPANGTATVFERFPGAESMRIDSSGNVGIGTTSPGALFHSNGTIRYTNRPAAGTITTLGFDTNGDLKASSSSQRYKHNINTYNKGLTELLALRPVSFVYNGETRENIGFIAEEVNEAGLTEVMLYDDTERPEGVMYANMVALLTKAIQELKVELDAVKVEFAALKGA